MNNINFSIIIPHRDSINTLNILLSSIPDKSDVEIIIIDNSINPLLISDILTQRTFKIIYSEPERGAGGARNEGINASVGQWLIFADADDYFPEDSFDVFYSHLESDSDVIYYCMRGEFIETGEQSDRGDIYTNLVRKYLKGEDHESVIRTTYSSPCGKMIKSNYVKSNGFYFDEVKAANDAYFALLIGFHANKIEAYGNIVYTATVSKGSLTRTRSYEIIKSRLNTTLKCNKFLRKHKLSHLQSSILFIFYQAIGVLTFTQICSLILLAISYKQNPFIISKTSISSFRKYLKRNKKESKLIVNY